MTTPSPFCHDARIGQLKRFDQIIYYAFPHGYAEPPVEGTYEHVVAALRAVDAVEESTCVAA